MENIFTKPNARGSSFSLIILLVDVYLSPSIRTKYNWNLRNMKGRKTWTVQLKWRTSNAVWHRLGNPLSIYCILQSLVGTVFFPFSYYFSFVYPTNSSNSNNFLHKACLLRAELARIALAYDSEDIYEAANISDLSEFEGVWKSKTKKHSFEEAMELYQCAIESAQKFGFQQYEALGIPTLQLLQFYSILMI